MVEEKHVWIPDRNYPSGTCWDYGKRASGIYILKCLNGTILANVHEHENWNMKSIREAAKYIEESVGNEY